MTIGEDNIIDDVFRNYLNKKSIFKNRHALRHDFIPLNFPHRKKQIKYIGEVLAPVIEGCQCSNLFLYGKTGTGKTAVIKYVLSKLNMKTEELNIPFAVCYINCRLFRTEYRILARLCNTLGSPVPFTGLAAGEVFERFKTALDHKNLLYIVVLDEVDALIKLRGDGLLYELTRINEDLHNSKLSIIGVSNDLRFKELLDPRVLSSLSEEELVFPPYNASELRDILLDRVTLAFGSNALLGGAIGLCAALAAAEHGDARRALDLLRVSAEIAEREQVKTIMEVHVRKAEKRIEHNRVVEALTDLPIHTKLVVFSVFLLNKKSRKSITGDIYEVYCELCSETSMIPLTQRRISGLINELDTMGILNSRVVSMGRYGRTKKISLGIACSLIKSVFLKDIRLRRLNVYTPRSL